MWRLGFLALASCSLIPVSSAAPRKDSTAPSADKGTEAEMYEENSLRRKGQLPAKAPPTVSPPDVPAPPILVGKGPFNTSGGAFANEYLAVSRQVASPWSGVSKGHPVKLAFDSNEWGRRDENIQCTAAVDHCLPAAAWFVVKNVLGPATAKTAHPVAFFADGPKRPSRLQGSDYRDYTAYRSVPATKKELVAGARVLALPKTDVPNAYSVYEDWQMGVVDRVDWDLGMLFFKDVEEAFFITTARIPVLSYEPETGVKILDGKKRDQLVPNAADLLLP